MCDYIIIPLTKDKETIISIEDSDLANLKWYAHATSKDSFYAAKRDKDKFLYLHRTIANRLYGDFSDNLLVDHANGNPLDNRRENIRLATSSQNNANSRKKKNNKSGFKGVSWDKKLNKWRVFITVNGKSKHVGLYNKIDDAKAAYKNAAIKLYGEYARFDD